MTVDCDDPALAVDELELELELDLDVLDVSPAAPPAASPPPAAAAAEAAFFSLDLAVADFAVEAVMVKGVLDTAVLVVVVVAAAARPVVAVLPPTMPTNAST